MRRFIAFVVIVLAIGMVAALPDAIGRAAPASGPIEAGDTVILNGRLFDGTGALPIEDGLVAVRGERMIAVGPRRDFDVPDGAEIIDAGGGFIMPGVIDSHVHLGESVFLGNDVLTPWLQDGVTTVRDLFTCVTCVPPLRRVIAVVAHDPPRVVIAGPGFTSPGGPRAGQGLVVHDGEEARAGVAYLLDEQGADLIKLYDPEMPLSISQAIVEEAHARGKRVASHPDGLVNAIAAGVDDVTHPPFTEVSDELLQRAAGAGIEMNSTLFGVPKDVLARYRDLGGVIAMGTDTPAAPGCQLPLYEMRDMVASGLTPREVLVASTKHAAIVSALGTELGTLEVGKIADIIVVDGDPLADISAMGDVSLVMKGGRLVDLTPPAATHDQFAFAKSIGALPFSDIANFYCAGGEGGEHVASCVFEETPRTVWYRFTPEAGGPIRVDLSVGVLNQPSAADAVGVYTGIALESLTEVACGYDQVTFAAEADTTYYLQIHGYAAGEDVFRSSSGTVQLERASAEEAVVPQLPSTGLGSRGSKEWLLWGLAGALAGVALLLAAAVACRPRWHRGG